jgi:hypothetical protein
VGSFCGPRAPPLGERREYFGERLRAPEVLRGPFWVVGIGSDASLDAGSSASESVGALRLVFFIQLPFCTAYRRRLSAEIASAPRNGQRP